MTRRIDASRVNVRKFGVLFGTLGVFLGAYLMYRGSGHWVWAAGAALFFFATALVGYPVLKPVYIAWMAFAFVLGWVNTRILLGLFYYLVLTPIGLILRLSGKDLIDQRIDREAKSYWKPRVRSEFDKARYERMF